MFGGVYFPCRVSVLHCTLLAQTAIVLCVLRVCAAMMVGYWVCCCRTPCVMCTTLHYNVLCGRAHNTRARYCIICAIARVHSSSSSSSSVVCGTQTTQQLAQKTCFVQHNATDTLVCLLVHNVSIFLQLYSCRRSRCRREAGNPTKFSILNTHTHHKQSSLSRNRVASRTCALSSSC